MIRRRFFIPGGWRVYIYYNLDNSDLSELYDHLILLGCSELQASDTCDVLRADDTGLTYTNPEIKSSIICVSNSSSSEQLVNTIVHEAKHLLSHICKSYTIDEDSEQAAYLIGYIVLNIYMLTPAIIKYGRFYKSNT